MDKEPIICFGQQPNGFFPRRYLYSKIQSARKLQKEIGGKIIFFYHDSDADYRETITILIDPKTKEEVRLNFTQGNKIQKKYSPLYIKGIDANWQDEIARKLPRFMGKNLIEIFTSINKKTVADFCLEMYKKMGLLDGIEIVRSGDKSFRERALDLDNYFADVEYEGQIVRAELHEGKLRLHEGGGKYFNIPMPNKIEKYQKNPNRDNRFAWMQSVLHCTHYVTGLGEGNYLKKEDFPEVVFVNRDEIENSEHASIPEI